MLRRHAVPHLRRCRSTSAASRKPRPPRTAPDVQKSAYVANSQNKAVVEKTQRLIERTRGPYFDPLNVSLDFGQPNRTLFAGIEAESRKRTKLRVEEPSAQWRLLHHDDVARTMGEHIMGARIGPADTLRPLAAGDLVLLGEKSTVLHLVLDVPQLLGANTYTFVNNEGVVSYGTRHRIKLRIPRVVPREWLATLGLVLLEKKHRGISPVGMPDADFSRSAECFPPGAEAEVSPEALLGLTNDDGSPIEPVGSLPKSSDDFIVAQAATHLLTDTDVKTYVMLTAARATISRYLTEIATSAFAMVHEYAVKLDDLSMRMQKDKLGFVAAPQTFPIFELFRMTSAAPAPHQESGSYTFGKELPVVAPATARFPISSYIAFITALSRSGRKWRMNVQKSTKTPISADLLPFQKSQNMEWGVRYLKGLGPQEMGRHYVAQLAGKAKQPPVYSGFALRMLKDFVAGNISNDAQIESIVGDLVRKIDATVQSANLQDGSSIPNSYDFSRCRAYEIVTTLEPQGVVNPARWSELLRLPGENTSVDSDYAQQLYKCIDEQYPSAESLQKDLVGTELSDIVRDSISRDFYKSDPMAKVRQDFGDTPVYCIDSETAHEIDDGIAIRKENDTYVVTIHVANPTSFLKQDSALSKIAYSKGTTVYLPEGATMMLPDILAKVCGLNGTGKTRTIAIEFALGAGNIDTYLNLVKAGESMPGDAVARQVLEDIKGSATVKFYEVSNFPKGYTYKHVNTILEDPKNAEAFASNKMQPGTHEDNLFKLFHISSVLRHVRIGLGRGLEVSQERPKVHVQYSGNELPDESSFQHVDGGWQLAIPKKGKELAPVITVTREINQNEDSKSQQLVSNFMIAGNFAGTIYAHKNEIPIIHRTQELGLSEGVMDQLHQLTNKAYTEKLTVEERSQYLRVMTSANYEVERKKHESLGLESYLNFTSPLRRYVDMVNHWNMQEFVLKGKVENAVNLDMVASQLQTCEIANKASQRFSERFWQGYFLKRYFELQKEGLIAEPIAFQFLLQSDIKLGDVSAEVLGFNGLSATILQDDYSVGLFEERKLEPGQVLANVGFEVEKLDYIENEFVLRLTNNCT